MPSRNSKHMKLKNTQDMVDTVKKKKMDTKDTDMADTMITQKAFMIVIGLEEEVYGLLLH